MRTTIKKALKKIAALVVVAQERQVNLSAVATADLVAELELQGQQSGDAGHGRNELKQAEERYVAIREPYQRHYSLVRVRGGRD